MKMLATLKKEMLYQWRSYRLLVAVAVLLMLGLLSPVIVKYTPKILELVPNGKNMAGLFPTPTVFDVIAQFVKNVSQIGVVLVLLLSMGAVATERDKGTAAMILCKPLFRSSFILAKFACIALVFILATAAAGAGGYYYTLLLFGPPMASTWIVMNAIVALYFIEYEAVTLLFSTLSTSLILAGGLTFGVMVVFSVLGALPTVGDYFPAQLLKLAAGAAAGAPLDWRSAAVAAGLIVAALAGAILTFREREL